MDSAENVRRARGWWQLARDHTIEELLQVQVNAERLRDVDPNEWLDDPATVYFLVMCKEDPKIWQPFGNILAQARFKFDLENFHLQMQQAAAEMDRGQMIKMTGQEFYEHHVKLDPTPFMIPGYLKQGHLAIIAAGPKAGKSTISREWAAAKILGREILGETVSPGRVLHCTFEEDWEDVLTGYQSILGNDWGDKLTIWNGLPPAHTFWSQLQEEMDRVEYDFVIIDPFGAVLPAGIDMNSYAEMQTWMLRNPHGIARKYNATILMVHHTNKALSNSTAGFLGSRGIEASTDCNIVVVEREDEKDSILRFKGRGIGRPLDHYIKWTDGRPAFIRADRVEAEAYENEAWVPGSRHMSMIRHIADGDYSTMDEVIFEMGGSERKRKEAFCQLFQHGWIEQIQGVWRCVK